jgi:hypothetical protein
MKTKQKLGQFFTTNVDHILQGFEHLVNRKHIVDPYAGGGDLLDWAVRNGAASIKGFDIDPKCVNNNISINDSLAEIPKIGDFNLTNPPYLAKNKMDKTIKNKYLNNDIEDFYLLAIKKIIDSGCNEGIIIIPVNFFSAENSDKIRNEFMSIYGITNINYFQNRVFEDTTYNVVAFHYIKNNTDKRVLRFTMFPNKEKFSFDVYSKYDYRIGGKDLYDISNCNSILRIKRLTEKDMLSNSGSYQIDGYYNDYNTTKKYKINKTLKTMIDNNIVLLNCIDGKTNNKICAEDIKFYYKKTCLIGKHTSRNIAYITIDNVSINEQRKLICAFNKTLNELRNKYHSLFLTNFRDNDRKRISFDFCYKLLNYCYQNKI